MTHQPFQKPLLELISEFVRLSKDDSACTCEETELHFVLVLEQLCKRIRDDKGLIDVFFVESGDFAIFSLLVSFMHRDGRLGQSAKDALLICVALSREDPRVGEFIANHSDFCPVSLKAVTYEEHQESKCNLHESFAETTRFLFLLPSNSTVKGPPQLGKIWNFQPKSLKCHLNLFAHGSNHWI